jgi:hypothetical protein
MRIAPQADPVFVASRIRSLDVIAMPEANTRGKASADGIVRHACARHGALGRRVVASSVLTHNRMLGKPVQGARPG